MIDRDTAEKIKNVADIVEVVSDYVHLTRRGANYMGLCPFHNERTPSFSVNKARNFCYCFSCHKGGSPVNFIMEKEGISYQDALRHLARKYGIEIRERELTDDERRARSEREALFVANDWAMKQMSHWLQDTDDGRNIGLNYLYHRGITPAAVQHFSLGYSPDRNTLETTARQQGYNPEILHTLGLLGRSQQGQYYDRFRGRVIYPVFNVGGKVAAFGGRDLKGTSPAKYINSPESAIYKKSNELYGLYQARSAMVKHDKCFLVEGYMDVISMWQSGVENVIASSGTALTDGQIALIHRFTSHVTLIYDGDAAGIKASLRGIDMLLAHDMDIKVLLLPDGHDPDSFARAHTSEELQEYITAHEEDFITFKARAILKDLDNASPSERNAAVRSVMESLSQISDKIKRNIYVKECSRILGVDETVLSYETDKLRQRIVADIRMTRQRKEQAQKLPQSATPTAATAPETVETPVPAVENLSAETAADTVINTRHSRLAPELRRLERRLLRYCVKYGMTDFYIDDNQSCPLVLYVRDELLADEIALRDPVCSRMLVMMCDMVEQFNADRADNFTHLQQSLQPEYEHRTAELIEASMDVPSLEAAEEKLRQQLQQQLYDADLEYCCNYIAAVLTSHEDDSIRTLACRLIAEPYTLSRYHSKSGHVLTEQERLIDLIPRALNELRAYLLEEEIALLTQQLKTESNPDSQRDLMLRLSRLQTLRKRFAEYNGDRIVAPRVRNRN